MCTEIIVLLAFFVMPKYFGTPGGVDPLAPNNIGYGEGGLTLLGVQVVLVRLNAPCESYTKKESVAINEEGP